MTISCPLSLRERILLAGKMDKAQCTAPKVRHSIAQGNALGMRYVTTIVALKGRNHVAPPAFVAPFQGAGSRRPQIPRALPWADDCDPFGVHGFGKNRRRKSRTISKAGGKGDD